MSLFVRKIQQHLIRLGYLKAQPSGEIDSETFLAFERLVARTAVIPAKRTIKIARYHQTALSITSELTVEGSNFTGFILEPKLGRIAVGLYQIEKFTNERYSGVFLLSNESLDRSQEVLIRSGNTPKDTSGCLLIGLATSKDWVSNSVLALNQLRRLIEDGGGADNFDLIVTGDFK